MAESVEEGTCCEFGVQERCFVCLECNSWRGVTLLPVTSKIFFTALGWTPEGWREEEDQNSLGEGQLRKSKTKLGGRTGK